MIRFRLKNGTEWQFGADFFGVLCLSWELGGAGERAALALLMAVLLHEGGTFSPISFPASPSAG